MEVQPVQHSNDEQDDKKTAARRLKPMAPFSETRTLRSTATVTFTTTTNPLIQKI